MIINHNMSAINANRSLKVLPTGKSGWKACRNFPQEFTRINRAGDDASGLAVSEKDEDPRSMDSGRLSGTRKTVCLLCRPQRDTSNQTTSIIQRMRVLSRYSLQTVSIHTGRQTAHSG